jgi:exodeoxyribonuclease VIII
MTAEADEPTPAMVFGTLFHWIVLEPEKFNSRVVVWEGDAKRGKEWTSFKEEAGDKNIITTGERDQLLSMKNSVYNSKIAWSAISGAEYEKSIFWPDPTYGVTCKVRPDVIKQGLYLISDLKTAEDASPEGFSRAAANFGYDIQAAFYIAGARAMTGNHYRDFIFIVVEKKPPYACAVYRASQEMLDAGRVKIGEVLPRYAECLDKDVWPGYGDGIQDLYLPRWAA